MLSLSTNLEGGGGSHWELPPSQRASNAQDKTNKFAIQSKFKRLYHYLFFCFIHLPFASRLQATLYKVLHFFAFGNNAVLYGFWLHALNYKQWELCCLWALVWGLWNSRKRQFSVQSCAITSSENLCVWPCFPDIKQTCKVWRLKRNGCFSRNWGKGSSWIEKQIVPCFRL